VTGGDLAAITAPSAAVLCVTVAAAAVRKAVAAGYSVVVTAPSLSFRPAPKPAEKAAEKPAEAPGGGS
jgi:hypothetical protein